MPKIQWASSLVAVAIALASLTSACTVPSAYDALSDALVMQASSTLEVRCSDGALGISFVGEAGHRGQILGCESDLATFKAVRDAGFANIRLLAPRSSNNLLQLRSGDYVSVMCEGDRARLAPIPANRSAGNMTLECY